MSDTPAAAAPLREVKIRLTDAVILATYNQAQALGFHTENSVMSLGITALSAVPPHKFFEVLAEIHAYHPSPKAKGARR